MTYTKRKIKTFSLLCFMKNKMKMLIYDNENIIDKFAWIFILASDPEILVPIKRS